MVHFSLKAKAQWEVSMEKRVHHQLLPLLFRRENLDGRRNEGEEK